MQLPEAATIKSPSGKILVIIAAFTNNEWPAVQQELADLRETLGAIITDFDPIGDETP